MASAILLPGNAEQRATSLRFMRSVRRGLLVAKAAAEYCASDFRRSAWQAFCLAQSQYRTSLEILLLSDDLTPAKRAEFRAAIRTLMEALGKLYLKIHDVDANSAFGDRGEGLCQGAQHPAGGCDEPDVLNKQAMAAGRRLIDALKLEQEFGWVFPADTECARSQWHEARRLVEMAQRDYDESFLRYRDAVLRAGAGIRGD